MEWKWSQQSCSEGNKESVHPAHPTRQACLNRLHLVYLKTRWEARYVQQLWYLSTQTLLTPPILDRVNQIKRHKPSTSKHAKQKSHLSGSTYNKKMLQMCCVLNHWCHFLRASVCVSLCTYTHTHTTLLILVYITKKQTTSLHCPVMLWPFLSPQGNVCFAAAWTVSPLTDCCAHLWVQACRQKCCV